MRFIAFPQRVRDTLGDLMEAYYAPRYPYIDNVMDGPEKTKNLPLKLKRGGIEEVNYLFNLCYFMLGALDSMTISGQFSKLYEAHADTLFDMKVVAEMDPAVVATMLAGEDIKVRASSIAVSWVTNAQRINARYDGDIRLAFKQTDGDWRKLYEALVASKVQSDDRGLIGYGKKIASMLAYFLMKNGLVDYFHMPPQVDFHVRRVFWSTNLALPIAADGQAINVLTLHQANKYSDVIRPLLVNYVVETNIPWTHVSECLWTHSRVLCSLSPSNKVTSDNDGPPYQEEILWTPNQVERYERSCGMCPIEPRCTNAIPSGYPYYQPAPRLRNHGPRQVPPYRIQSLIDLSSVAVDSPKRPRQEVVTAEAPNPNDQLTLILPD